MATGFTRQHRALRLRSRKRLARRSTLGLNRCMFMRSTMRVGRLSRAWLALRFCAQSELSALRDSKLGSDSKKILLSINGKRLWTFNPAHLSGERENVKIQSLNSDSVEAVGYDGGKPVRVTCKLEDRGQ